MGLAALGGGLGALTGLEEEGEGDGIGARKRGAPGHGVVEVERIERGGAAGGAADKIVPVVEVERWGEVGEEEAGVGEVAGGGGGAECEELGGDGGVAEEAVDDDLGVDFS